MKVVENLLKKIVRLTLLIVVIGSVFNSIIIIYLFVNEIKDKSNIEKKHLVIIIGRNYELGNLIRIRSELDSTAASQFWINGSFSNEDDEVLWSFISKNKNREQVTILSDLGNFTFKMMGYEGSDSLLIKKVYKIEGEDKILYGTLKFTVSERVLWEQLITRIAVVLSIIFILWLIFIFVIWYLTNRTLMPLMSLISELQNEGQKVSLDFKLSEDMDEISSIIEWFKLLMKSWIKTQSNLIEMTKLAAVGEVSHQVAHDIRSPLAALDMIITSKDLEEEQKRVIIRDAVHRINDIANGLLEKNRLPVNDHKQEVSGTVLLSDTIDSIVTEKRTMLRSKSLIDIAFELSLESYGLFVNINPIELKRVLSNLINNAIESIKGAGHVNVILESVERGVEIRIIDTGLGMDKRLISQLGKKRISVGKKNGNGVGLFHAMKTIKLCGGELFFESTLDVGTTAIIRLPLATPPEWFMPELIVDTNSTIVVIDDDSSIHQIWDNRFYNVSKNIIHIYDPEEFEQFHYGKQKNILFLVDYEFVGCQINGLDLIDKTDIKKNTCLVTSRNEDQTIQHRASKMGVKIIPKRLAVYIPILFKDVSNNEVEYVLLDDDELVRLTWSYSANKLGISFKEYSNADDMMKMLGTFSKDTFFYIDSDLGDEVKGEDVAKNLYELGYKNIYLATGYEAEHFQYLTFLKGVVGKMVPWPLSTS